ncbi:MAG: toxin-antitoxin system HicB family antitoxin [Acidobacteria bacterium]|nr:toxin-antitoxin system HicB family antitoxin [Acidobacteriota bacterium]
MAKTIEIPDALHADLERRAATEGLTLSELVLRELQSQEGKLTPAEVWERIQRRSPVNLGAPAADLVREAREERDRELENALRRR